jgi:acyl-CoA reductase-like NAD-dependent aldehyde dehydrogenase
LTVKWKLLSVVCSRSKLTALATDLQLVPQRLTTTNPATGEVLREFTCASSTEVKAAVLRAKALQPAWRDVGLRTRLEVIRRFLRILAEKKSEIAELVTREAGKPYAEAILSEVLVAVDAARFYLSDAHALLRDEPVPHANILLKAKKGRLVREPYGVVGIISPWNYPFSIPATESMAALVAGNAVVVKPSEFTSLVALKLEDLFRAAGVPDGVFQVVVGDGATGAALVEADLDKLIFTGSLATGKRVAQSAAARLLPVVLELGGKDPMLVLDDADIDVASSAAVWGAFMNAGQTCLSVERCYVHRNLYEKFLAACVKKTQRLRVGNGMEAATDIGPMIHERQLETVEAHVGDAKSRGARVLAGGMRLPELGPNFYAPTILADVTHDMRIMREETFGPVLPVMPFDTDADAVRLANDSEFGLAASVWTRDKARGEAMARRIEAGTVMVNDVIACYGISEAPHGGVKSSGLGRTHGRIGLEEMVRIKYVDSDLLPGMPKVWWFGYGSGFGRQLEGFVDYLAAGSLMRRLAGGLRSVKSFFRRGRL